MENSSEINTKKNAPEITEVYELAKSKKFTQDLWSDVISDLRQKPTYVHLKGMVEKAIETSMQNYTTNPEDHEEKIKTRKAFSELSILAYTVDYVISNILKKKLKDEITSMVSNVLDDYNSRINASNIENKTKAVIMLEDIGKLLCCNDKNDNEESNGSTNSSSPRRRRSSEEAASSQPASKRRNKQGSIVKEPSLTKNSSLHKAYSNITKFKSRSPSKRLGHKGKKSSTVSDDENSDVDVLKVSDVEDDNHSIRSVSSVHTSDLSSFEDDISISSEDENGAIVKKRISLKLAKDLYSQGRLSDLRKVQETDEKISETSMEQSFDSTNQRSSTRMRKPNSKYASDDIVCPMKLNLSQTDLYISDTEGNGELFSTHISEKRSPSPNMSTIKRKKSNKDLKNSMSKRNSFQDSESSNESDSSLPPSPKTFKNEGQTLERRGRPRKDKLLSEQTSPAMTQMSNKETKRKRGRPRKDSIEAPKSFKKQCVLDNMLPNLEKKLLQSPKTAQSPRSDSKLNALNNDPEIKSKKDRQSGHDSLKQMDDDEPIKHSVESFSKFEESLCVKTNSPTSPSKNTKSYDTDDLYKPRSDFRIFNSTKRSRALTLFSN